MTAPTLIGHVEFPRVPGAYVVWNNGREPLYVGVAATQTLERRWRSQHLYPRAGGSALRRTLGVHLGLVDTKLRSPARYYPASVEAAITEFLLECAIEFRPARTPQEARGIETQLIRELQPRLNVRR